MKTRTKIIIPLIFFLSLILFFAYLTDNGFNSHEGMGLVYFSDYQLQKELEYEYMQGVEIVSLTDDDLKEVPKVKELINKALSKEFPKNKGGTASISYEQLDNFQLQYANILAEKYSRNSTSFFEKQDVSEKQLLLEPSLYLRQFEAYYFEYENKQYGIQPTRMYVPNFEKPDTFYLEVYKTNGPLREKDHTWADLTDKGLEIEPLIIAAIDNIGKIEENIEVQNSMSSAEVDRYQKWYEQNITSNIFEYDGNYFRIGFWIA
ncbi:hypothetical protein [Nitrosarchaeum sp. AC2]|uniref:hypothetical protein n=1 Tax=Nitrosarchaeum sp. AC2 TaxID=2259673 RepID=UPI0015C9CDF3|nr:hypothetical protein [Nitrosarchaeum sp. AC2]